MIKIYKYLYHKIWLILSSYYKKVKMNHKNTIKNLYNKSISPFPLQNLWLNIKLTNSYFLFATLKLQITPIFFLNLSFASFTASNSSFPSYINHTVWMPCTCSKSWRTSSAFWQVLKYKEILCKLFLVPSPRISVSITCSSELLTVVVEQIEVNLRASSCRSSIGWAGGSPTIDPTKL